MWAQVTQCESVINSSNRAVRDISLSCSPQDWELLFPFQPQDCIGGSTEQILLFPCSVGSAAPKPPAHSPGAAGEGKLRVQVLQELTPAFSCRQAQNTFSSKLGWQATGRHPILSAPIAGTKASTPLNSPLADTSCRDYCHPSVEWRQLLLNRTSDSANLLFLSRTQACSTARADHINSTLLWS